MHKKICSNPCTVVDLSQAWLHIHTEMYYDKYQHHSKGGKCLKHILITAHSGCDGTPDNSKAFIDYALGLGVDCIEVDVRSINNELVMAHDPDHPAFSLSYAFEKLKAHSTKKINCDLKHEGLEAEVWELAKQYGVSEQLIYSGSVSAENMKVDKSMQRSVAWYMNIEIVLPEVYSDMDIANGPDASDHAERVKAFFYENNVACLNINFRLLKSELCKLLTEHGIPMSVWTPDAEKDLLDMVSAGVHNITTRNAAWAVKTLPRIYTD